MQFVKTGMLAAIVVATAATGASAMSPIMSMAPMDPAGLAPQPVVYGYGPEKYGVYTHHRHHHGRSYGTGYHGRGTRTGGPVGGLPSRN